MGGNGKLTKENAQAFLVAALIRAAKTAAQTAAALMSPALAGAALDMKQVALTSLLAAAYSLVTSLAAGLPEVSESDSVGGPA